MTSSINTNKNVKNLIASEVSKIRRSPPHGVRILRKESDATDNSLSPHVYVYTQEMFELMDEVYNGGPAEPVKDRVMQPIAQCFAVIDAPGSTPYEKGHFRLRIDFFETYPDKPPRVFFLTPIFHPNVKRFGEILPTVMERGWDSSSRVRDVFQKVNDLFVQNDPVMAWNEKSQKLRFIHLEDFAGVSKACTEMFAVYDSRTGPMKSQGEDDESLEFMTDDNGRLIRKSWQFNNSTKDHVRSVMLKLDEDDQPKGVESANQTNPENDENTSRVAPPSKIMSRFKYLFGASVATAATAAAAVYFYDTGD